MSTAQLDSIFHDLSSIVADTDYTETLEEFQHVIAGVEMQAFGGEHEPGGEPWAELKPSTIRRKGHDRILYDSGDLMASLIEVGGPGNISEVMDHGSLFGTDVPYAIYHEDYPGRSLPFPPRPFVGINQEAVDKLADMVAERTLESIANLRSL